VHAHQNIGSRTGLIFRAAFAAALIFPARNGREKSRRATVFAAQCEMVAHRHGPVVLSVIANLTFVVLLGAVTIQRGGIQPAEIQATIGGFFTSDEPAGRPPEGGGAPLPSFSVTTAAPAEALTPSVITTTAPAVLSFSVPTSSVSLPGLPSGAFGGRGGTGGGTGTGVGQGSGAGSGSGTGGGNGRGSGGSGAPMADTRIPIILVYTTYESISWSATQLKEARATGDARFNKVLNDLHSTFRVVAVETVNNNNAGANRYTTSIDERPESGNLDNKDIVTNARLIYELALSHPEAAAIVYCAGWEDTDGTPEGRALSEELGRRLAGVGMRLYLMTFSRSKGWGGSTPLQISGKITGGGFRNSVSDISYELGKTYTPPQQGDP